MRYFLILLLFSFGGHAEAENNKIANAWKLSPLVLPDLENKQRNLYDWHGKVIILNFWATWCGPCQIEIPHLMQFQEQYAGKGLQVVGVGLDDTRKLQNYVRTVGINYPVLHADPEENFSLLATWGNPFGTLPYTVVINRQGGFVLVHQGIFSEEIFNQFVLPLLSADLE